MKASHALPLVAALWAGVVFAQADGKPDVAKGQHIATQVCAALTPSGAGWSPVWPTQEGT